MAQDRIDYAELYRQFDAPVTRLNCGDKCSPYNEHGIPFCCDQRHAIPTAYEAEWDYLRSETDLWHPWQGRSAQETEAFRQKTPDGQVLIACQGHLLCQRSYRSITCRSFPFFPYLSREGEFLGLSYYWEYEDRCWVISNLAAVTPGYRSEFIQVYDFLFDKKPEERETFRRYSNLMRQVFGRKKRTIPLLHRNGNAYKITPKNGRIRRVALEQLPKYGPYQIASEMPFPGEE